MEKTQKPIVTREIRHTTRNIMFAILVFGFLFLVAPLARAATLYFSPASGSHAVGETFSVGVYVSSSDQAMNAASGMISFPADKLAVTALSKTGSIFNLLVQEPSFSNSAGTVNFEGIVLNPGFSGASGKVLTVTFKAKAAGSAPLTFSSGAVLANDGQGTNILTSLGGAAFSLGESAPITAPEAAAPKPTGVGLPAGPVISSPTHPDPNKWYAFKNAKFTWELPSGVNGVRLLVGQNPNAVPTVTYIPPIRERELTDIEDGTWYLSVRLRNNAGWGEISHFRFQVDTKPPEPFKIQFIEGKETQNPRPTVLFNTTDSLSGIAYYKIKISDGDSFVINSQIVSSNPHTLPPQTPGKKTILVQAFDQAGNYQTAAEEFTILPLKAPVITDYPKRLQSKETLIVKGTTNYPQAQTTVWLEREGEKAQSQIVRNDTAGNFTFVAAEKLKDGTYQVWAEVTDERGAKSTPSEKIAVTVEPPAFLTIGARAVSFLSVAVPLAVLVFILLFMMWYGWHKFKSWRKKLGKIKQQEEDVQAELALQKAFVLLKDDLHEQIAMFEKTRTKRQLTTEEKKVMRRLKKDLDDAEKILKEELDGMERGTK